MATNVNEKIEKQEEQIRTLTQIMFAVVLVLLVAVGAMFATVGTLVWNAHLFGQDTYQKLVNELGEQNNKIDTLLQELSEIEK